MTVNAPLAVQPTVVWTGRRLQAAPWSETYPDPLVAEACYNMQRSPLYGLSDELLLKIMRHLDTTSLQCLRKVSRTFLRLSSSREFRCYHANDENDFNLPWQRFAFRAKDGELVRLLRQDLAHRQCFECQERVRKWSWHRYLRV